MCTSCDDQHILANGKCNKKYYVAFAVQIQGDYNTFV